MTDKLFTVYKIDFPNTGKYYIGVHKEKPNENLTKYMGSGGTLLNEEKEKDPNFTKSILHRFDNEKEMLDKEYELVNFLTLTDPLCLNSMIGGAPSPFNNRMSLRDKRTGKTLFVPKDLYKQYKETGRYEAIREGRRSVILKETGEPITINVEDFDEDIHESTCIFKENIYALDLDSGGYKWVTLEEFDSNPNLKHHKYGKKETLKFCQKCHEKHKSLTPNNCRWHKKDYTEDQLLEVRKLIKHVKENNLTLKHYEKRLEKCFEENPNAKWTDAIPTEESIKEDKKGICKHCGLEFAHLKNHEKNCFALKIKNDEELDDKYIPVFTILVKNEIEVKNGYKGSTISHLLSKFKTRIVRFGVDLTEENVVDEMKKSFKGGKGLKHMNPAREKHTCTHCGVKMGARHEMECMFKEVGRELTDKEKLEISDIRKWCKETDRQPNFYLRRLFNKFKESSSSIIVSDNELTFQKFLEENDLIDHKIKFLPTSSSSRQSTGKNNGEWVKNLIEDGYTLIHEHHWNNRKEVVETILLSKFNKLKTKAIYARKTKIIEVDKNSYREFLDKNHIAGSGAGDPIRYGLVYDGELVSVMGFKSVPKEDKTVYNLNRFAVKDDIRVVGGASKLFKYFLKTNNPRVIITFSFDEWSDGALYKDILKFEFIHRVKPDHLYVNKYTGEDRHKFNFRHGTPLKRILGDKYDPSLSEWENMKDSDWYSIPTGGLTKWEYINDNYEKIDDDATHDISSFLI